MNLRFKSVEINNFRSIEKAKVLLEQRGIVIVKGINEYEDKATSNGSGKSSIFESILFALFEETSEGEKDVANRIINKGYYICLNFQIDENEYKIIRENDGKRSSVQLYKNGIEISARNKTDTNKLIIQILGVNKNLFLDSIFLSQNVNTNLASLSPTARKERLEIITNTDNIVNQFKEKFKQLQLEYESKCVENEKQNSELYGRKEILVQQNEQYKQKISEIEKQIEYRNSLGNLEQIERDIEQRKNQKEQCKSQVIKLEEDINEVEKRIFKCEDEYKNLSSVYEEKNLEIQKIKTEEVTTKSKIEMKLMEIHNLEQQVLKFEEEQKKISESDKCPTCGRTYDNITEEQKEYIVNQINILKDNIYHSNLEISEKVQEKTRLQNEIENLQSLIQEREQNLKSFYSEVINKEEEKQKLYSNKQEFISQKNQVNNNITEIDYELDRIEDLKETILNIKIGNIEEFQSLLNENIEMIQDIQNQMSEINSKFTENDNFVGTCKHCQQLVTKEFRTYLLRNSIDYLNKILRDYSPFLFSNENDYIYIVGDDSHLDIRLGDATYESLSGGEKTRVNIALLLAQKSLASSIGNMNCNLIILDEILGYCDNQAETNVINLLTQELGSLETVFMVSHKEISIGYDEILWVVKDKNGLTNISNR